MNDSDGASCGAQYQVSVVVAAKAFVAAERRVRAHVGVGAFEFGAHAGQICALPRLREQAKFCVCKCQPGAYGIAGERWCGLHVVRREHNLKSN